MSKLITTKFGEKYANIPIYFEDVLHITANINDFDGDGQKWRNSIYDMFRWDMTYSFAYKIDVIEGRNGVFLSIVAKPAYEESILGTMEDLGFRNVKAYHENIGKIECTEIPEGIMVDFMVVD